MEEDMKIIKNVIYDLAGEKRSFIDIGNMPDNECDNFIQAIENLIQKNKELEEENKRLKIELEIKKYCKVNELTEDLIYYKNLAKEYQGNCIPKSKVKEKIEELNNKIDGDDYWKYSNQDYVGMQYQVKVLQELIED